MEVGRRAPDGAFGHREARMAGPTRVRDLHHQVVNPPDATPHSESKPTWPAPLPPPIAAVDLFCGAGGLSQGLQEAGISVVAGIDVDPQCRFPFEHNIEASFLEADIRDIRAGHLGRLWPEGAVTLLAGCAPCQPFSAYRRGADTSGDEKWALLAEFGRLVREARPHLVTMENVPRISSTSVFSGFLTTLTESGYAFAWRSCYGPDYGLAQGRRRLVLVGSRLGPARLPTRQVHPNDYASVRDVIGDLPPLAAGGSDHDDPLHTCRRLSAVNLERIRASVPGGTWESWPSDLRAPCHQKASGASFRNVYARMEWDKPAPTITTMAFNFGTGRFGHPEQDRPISLREAALLQGFPRDYAFVKPGAPVQFTQVGRLIGNAVPPPLGRAIGEALTRQVRRVAAGQQRLPLALMGAVS